MTIAYDILCSPTVNARLVFVSLSQFFITSVLNRILAQCIKTSQVTYVTLVPRGNETLRRNARGTPSALSSSESYV